MTDAEFLLGNDWKFAQTGKTPPLSWVDFVKHVVNPDVVGRDFICAEVSVNERLKYAGDILVGRALAIHGMPIDKEKKFMFDSTINRQTATIRILTKEYTNSVPLAYHELKDAKVVVQALEALIKQALSHS